jgi:hypothetical protein
MDARTDRRCTGKQNLMLIDAYLLLERELEQTRKRSYSLRLPTDADASSAMAQVSLQPPARTLKEGRTDSLAG